MYGPLLPDHRTPKVNSGSFHLITVVTLANYFIRGPLKHSKGPELAKQRKHFPVERQRSRKASRPREYLAQSSVTLCKNILSRYFSSLFYPKQKMLWPPTSGKCHVVKPAWSSWLSFFSSAASFYPPLVWPKSRATRSVFASCRILIDPPSWDISHAGMFPGVVPGRLSLRFPYSCWTCCNTWLDENVKINRMLFAPWHFPQISIPHWTSPVFPRYPFIIDAAGGKADAGIWSDLGSDWSYN